MTDEELSFRNKTAVEQFFNVNIPDEVWSVYSSEFTVATHDCITAISEASDYIRKIIFQMGHEVKNIETH